MIILALRVWGNKPSAFLNASALFCLPPFTLWMFMLSKVQVKGLQETRILTPLFTIKLQVDYLAKLTFPKEGNS